MSPYLDIALSALRARHIGVYMVLTGAYYDMLGTRRTSVFYPGGPDGFSGLNTVNPTQFGSFVHDAVTHYAALGVTRYAMWNEPNLSREKGFLQVRCGDARRSLGRQTPDLYRRLYEIGRRQAKAAGQDLRISVRTYLGELSEQTQGGRPTCSGGKAGNRSRLDVLKYLDAVVNAPAARMTNRGRPRRRRR